MSFNTSEVNDLSKLCTNPDPNRIENTNDSSHVNDASNSFKDDTVQSTSTTRLENTDLDLIETAHKMKSDESSVSEKKLKRKELTEDDVIDHKHENMNTIEELSQRIKGYNGSRLHRIMSRNFVSSAEERIQNEYPEKDSNSTKTCILFDDASGIENVDIKLDDTLSTKPYLQIEQFHKEIIKPFNNATENQRTNVIAKEALKADVYKVQSHLRFQSIPCIT